MSPVGRGELSLTKFYRLRQLARELAAVAPGMTELQARSRFGPGHRELADDLLLYRSGQVVDDPLLKACRAGSADVPVLILIALVMADHRFASIIETHLTDGQGKLVSRNFNTGPLEQTIDRLFPGTGGRKAATNILSYYRDSGLVVPINSRGARGTIVGIARTPSAAVAVPAVVEYVAFRLKHLRLGPPAPNDLEMALAVRANKWINLTPAEFRAAYGPTAPVTAPSSAPALRPSRGPSSTPRPATRPASPPAPATGPSPVAPGPSVVEVPVEAGNVENYPISAQAERSATRRERTLVQAYKRWMGAKGSTIVRLLYRIPGTDIHINCDVWDKTRNNLLEAKGTVRRNDVRMAVGQLIDYRRLTNPAPSCAVLLPQRPHQDLADMLRTVGIAAVWRDGDAFDDNASGQFS